MSSLPNSLTISRIDGDKAEVSLVPHTIASTIAQDYQVGDAVNLEADILAKYVARYVSNHNQSAEAR